MKRNSIWCLLFLLPVYTSAQAPAAIRYYQDDGSTYWLDGTRIRMRADGRPILMASADTVHLNGMDAQGVIQWTSAFSVPNSNITVLHDMVPLSDGTLAACGFTGNSPETGLFLHLDTLGNILHARTYAFEFNMRLFAIADHGPGQVRVAGWQQFPTSYQAVLLDLDLAGNVLSSSVFQIGGVPTRPFRLQRLSDGGHMMIGGSWAFNTGGNVTFKSACMARIDSAGQVLWGRRFVVSMLRTYPQGLAVLPGGNSIYSVRSESNLGNNAVLIKLDPLGNLLDTLQLDPASPSDGYLAASAMSVQGDSVLVLSGLTNIADAVFSLRIDTALSSPEMLMHDRQHSQWVTDQLTLDNGSILKTCFAVSPVADNCILLDRLDPAGYAACSNMPCVVNTSTPGLITYTEVTQSGVAPVIGDVASLFHPATITVTALPDCIPAAVEEGSRRTPFTLLPNPASDRITIQCEGIRSVEIIKVTGGVVLSRSFQREGSVNVDISGFPAGLYHVRIRTNDGWRSEKLVKE